MASTTETKYGVARGKKILTVNGHPHPSGAKDELARIEKGMRDVGLEPDVSLVEYDVTTTIETSAPRKYVEPSKDDAPAPDAPAAA